MRLSTLAIAALIMTAPAYAHDSKGPNGGHVTDLGPYHAELTAKDKVVEVYLTDPANKPVSVAGFKGVAILSVRNQSERVELQPAGANKLSGTAGVPVPQNPRGVVRVTLPDGKTNQAKF